MDELLKVKNLYKMFPSKVALNDISFSVPKGTIVGLLGPNGSGKTTFMKILNKLLTVTSGEVFIEGMVPSVETKKIVSYLPDKTYLNEWMNVEELINYFADFYDDFNKEKAYDMLENLGINSKDRLKTMSKGTKEKVQLILVMSRNAKLYLLDEPIGGVDPASRDYILNTILNNYSENSSIIISTHLISDIEPILDRVLFLKDGGLVLDADVDKIREEKGVSIDKLFREEFKC